MFYMCPKIIVTEPEYFTLASLKAMQKVGDVAVKRINRDELLRLAPMADALVVRSQTRVDKELLKKAQNLKCVISATIGIDHVDTKELKKRGITFFSLTGTYSKSAAEHALALLLSTARNIPQAHIAMLEGKWDRSSYIGSELTDKTLGIFGLGRVGAELAELSKGFRFTVLGYDPFLPSVEIKKRGAEKVSFKELLKKSDLVSLHAPLTKETKGAFNASAFAAMKRSAILVNTGRGALIEVKALLNTLKKGLIRAVAIDVYEKEPLPSKHPFRAYARTHNNLILTPHLGASTQEAIERASIESAELIVKFFRKLT